MSTPERMVLSVQPSSCHPSPCALPLRWRPPGSRSRNPRFFPLGSAPPALNKVFFVPGIRSHFRFFLAVCCDTPKRSIAVGLFCTFATFIAPISYPPTATIRSDFFLSVKRLIALRRLLTFRIRFFLPFALRRQAVPLLDPLRRFGRESGVWFVFWLASQVPSLFTSDVQPPRRPRNHPSHHSQVICVPPRAIFL